MVQRQYRCLSFLLLGLLIAPAYGQEKVELKWKFEKGKTIYQELNTDTTQDMTVVGMKVQQKQKQTFYFSWTPVDQKDNHWIIKQRIEGVKMEIEIGGNKISFDSTSPTAANNPLADFFKALIGSEFTLTLDDKMKVTKVEGRQEFIAKLGSTNQQMKPLLESILSEEALKQMSDPSFAAIPGKEVAKDDKWENVTNLSLGPIGSYKTTYEYKFAGKDEKNKDLDRINVTAKVAYTPPSGDTIGAGLPFKIKNATLEAKSASGWILFDAKLGRIDSSETTLTLEGKLDIEIGGMSNPVDLKQTQKTTVKTSDTPQTKKGM